MNFYLKLRDLRKYFFSKLIVWLKFTYLLICHVNLYPLMSDSIDYSVYAYNIVEYSFSLTILIFLCFLLFPIEAFLCFIKRKYVLKKESEHILFHKNKWINIIDCVYTVFFLAMLFYAFVEPFA